MTAGRPAGEVAQALWQRLLAEPWPLPLQALPAGTALVGGAVRDGLLGCLEPQPDLDFVVDGDAIALTRQLARDHGGTVVILDVDHNIARLVLGAGISTWPGGRGPAWRLTCCAATTASMPSPCRCRPAGAKPAPWWIPAAA